jgi:molybdopterin synthase sulfur carrier subunit
MRISKVSPMIEVQLGATLRAKADGRASFPVEAANVKQLLDRLAAAYPELAPILERGVAVAINGRLYQRALLQPIPDGAEVFLMPRVAGG